MKLVRSLILVAIGVTLFTAGVLRVLFGEKFGPTGITLFLLRERGTARPDPLEDFCCESPARAAAHAINPRCGWVCKPGA
jgi:hypothetical protein